MSSWSDKANEQYDKAMGSAKESIGKGLNDRQLKSEGATQNSSGQAQGVKNSISDTAKSAGEQIQGAIGGATNTFSGNNSTGTSGH